MISNKRQDIIEEQLLRENIRRAIRLVKSRHDKKDNTVRTIIRALIKEASQVKYEYTALNLLAHFIKEAVGDPSKPDSSPAFKEAFTDLTSSPGDREIFVEEILDLAHQDFITLDANKQPKALGQDFVERGFEEDEEIEEEFPEEDEVITVTVDDLEGRGGDLTAEEEDSFKLGEEEIEIEDEQTVPTSGIVAYAREAYKLSLMHISEHTRLGKISYAVFC